MIGSISLEALQTDPRIRFYFRYPLRKADFQPIRTEERLRGHFAAKPLYDRLTPAGRVDKSAGLSGRVVVLFLPAEADSPAQARLLFTELPKELIEKENGRRNWPAIRQAAQAAVRRHLDSQNHPREII